MNIKSIIMTIAILGIQIGAFNAVAEEYVVTIKDHQFVPNQIEMKAGEKHRLIVINNDATPEEFESYELNREKIVSGNSKIVIFLTPLKAGEYSFFGEFNPKTAQGRIVVK
ncbi:MAG: cupredoxin domain-containing protein [Mariprofundaceae bacterium]|nr:cupredoxin domain-containing protein [Mariprofundaceae bacterium]